MQSKKNRKDTKSPCEGVGIKYDSDKPQWHLLPWDAVSEIVKVLTVGVKKYSHENWKHVDNSRDRYFSALIRHVVAWKGVEKKDPETGLSHLAHAGCCILFLLWFEINNKG